MKCPGPRQCSICLQLVCGSIERVAHWFVYWLVCWLIDLFSAVDWFSCWSWPSDVRWMTSSSVAFVNWWMTVSCSRLYNVMPTFVAFILAWSTVISYKRRPTLGVINILAGQNLLTTLDTPVVDPKKRDIGRKSRYLPCDAMCKRGLCRHAVSVCLSVCNCREFRTSNRIFKFFLPPDSQTIL